MSEKKAVPSFRDAQGREWHPVVNCNTMLMFERETKCGAFSPETLQEIQSGGMVGKILTLAFLACRCEAEERGETLNEFCESLDSDIQLRNLADAIGEATILFFQSRTKSASDAPAAASGKS